MMLAGPTWSFIAAGECELRVGEFRLNGWDRLWVILGEFFDGRRIAATDSAKQILCLVF
jgi:hypothetical protein